MDSKIIEVNTAIQFCDSKIVELSAKLNSMIRSGGGNVAVKNNIKESDEYINADLEHKHWSANKKRLEFLMEEQVVNFINKNQ